MNESFIITIQNNRLLELMTVAFLGFALGMLLTPIYTTFAFKYKWWKKQRSTSLAGGTATVFAKLHKEKHSRNIPTMAGIIFILSVAIVTLIFNLSREQTWLPLAAFIGAGLIGLSDDIINIKGSGGGSAGLPAKVKLLLTCLIGLFGGLYFFAKLDVNSLFIPGYGDITIGWLIVPLFILVVVSTTNAVNFSDGLDGLAGGLASSAFAAYAVIAFLQGRYGIAGFCLTIVGALLSYTWFNVFPARFFMGDSGSYALGTALGVVAMITNSVLLLPIIGAVFVAEVGSVIINVSSRKLRNGKKVFLSSPIHHHFEAIGWPETKITMRFWILGQVSAFVGLMLFILTNSHV